jgi:DNA-binding CsgD family transcriptional regulator
MGIPGVGHIRPGAHVCALYSGPDERDRLLVPFMQEGLRHGDQCVYLIDDLAPVTTGGRACEPRGPRADRRPEPVGRYPAPDVYLRAGHFSLERMISALVAGPAASGHDDIPLLRAAGEMSRASPEPGAMELSVYESAVAQILVELPTLFLCLYDLQRPEVGMVVSVLRIHSKVLVDGAVLHNPSCLESTDDAELRADAGPPYPLARIRTDVDAEDRWLSLTGAEVRVAELVASGMTNRATAEELIVSPHTVDAHLKHMYVKLGIHSRVELTVLALQHARPTA